MKSILFGIIATVIIIAGGSYILSTQKGAPEVTENTTVSTTTPAHMGSETESSNTPNTSSQPNGTATPVQRTYTLADVARHATEQSCWSAINGNVYDLTEWVTNHPGGSRAILSICGKDGSAAFSGKHGGQERPEQTLKSFLIGTLKRQ